MDEIFGPSKLVEKEQQQNWVCFYTETVVVGLEKQSFWNIMRYQSEKQIKVNDLRGGQEKPRTVMP